MTSELKLTTIGLSTLPFMPGDCVQAVSADDDDPDWLLGAEGVVESVLLTADPDNWQCTVCFDLSGKRILMPDDLLEEVIYELLIDPLAELPDELPIYETEIVYTVYVSQLKSADHAYTEDGEEDIMSV